MIERRNGRERRQLPRADDFGVEQALETVRFLRPEIVEFVRSYGAGAAQYFDRVITVWYNGTLKERVELVKACSEDPALHRAWNIVHAAGALASPLIPYAVRWYYREGSLDKRV